jgi:hypothetical protein
VAVVAIVGTTATVPDDISSSVAKALQRTAQHITQMYGRHEGHEADDVAVSS